MTSVRAIALITENETDYWPVRKLIERISKNDRITFKPKFGNGSGKMVGKCLAWSKELAIKGCDLLIIVHDRDTNDLIELERKLEEKLANSPIGNRFICIPIQELEAWFLADTDAIKKAFGLRKFPIVKGMPEDILDPKEKLKEMLYKQSDKKILYTTLLGKSIAPHLDLTKLSRRADSFKKFQDFIISQSF